MNLLILIIALLLPVQALTCQTHDWFFGLSKEEKVFKEDELRKMDHSQREIFFSSLYRARTKGTTILSNVKTLIDEGLDYVLMHAKNDVFRPFNFQGALYVLGMIDFDEYNILRSRSGLSVGSTLQIMERLNWLVKHRDDIVEWSKQFSPKKMYNTSEVLGWKDVFTNIDQGLNLYDFFQTQKYPLPFLVKPIRSHSDHIERPLSIIYKVRLNVPGLPLQNDMAVKLSTLKPHFSTLEHFSRMELFAGQLLNRAGILTPFGYMRYRHSNQTFDLKFMPFLPRGRTLDELVGHMSTKDILKYFLKAVEEIIYAFEMGVLHNDIKPDNIYLDTQGRVYLLDFGISSIQAAAHRRGSQSQVTDHWIPENLAYRIDESGINQDVFFGSPEFIPPEIIGGGMFAHSGASQVFMLGGALDYLVPNDAWHQRNSIVFQRVRKLFKRATIRNPLRRLSLQGFKDELESLIELYKAMQ